MDDDERAASQPRASFLRAFESGLEAAGFDSFVDWRCQAYYAPVMGSAKPDAWALLPVAAGGVLLEIPDPPLLPLHDPQGLGVVPRLSDEAVAQPRGARQIVALVVAP